MTTTVKIENKTTSNGVVRIRGFGTWANGASTLEPGESTEYGITDSSMLHIFETMPSTRPAPTPPSTTEFRDAVHALLDYDSTAPKEVQDRVFNLLHGVK